MKRRKFKIEKGERNSYIVFAVGVICMFIGITVGPKCEAIGVIILSAGFVLIMLGTVSAIATAECKCTED